MMALTIIHPIDIWRYGRRHSHKEQTTEDGTKNTEQYVSTVESTVSGTAGQINQAFDVNCI